MENEKGVEVEVLLNCIMARGRQGGEERGGEEGGGGGGGGRGRVSA